MSQVSKRDILRAASLKDFEIFREEYLGHPSYKAQKRWIDLVNKNRRVLTLCPGGHGKSMTAVDYITWLIIVNRYEKVLGRDIGELNIVIVSLSAELGTKWMMQIKQYLESPKIVRDFGTFRNKKRWSADAIIVLSPNNKDARVDHPTVQALGIGGQVFGLRADLIVADDVVDKENSGTPPQRKKLWELFAEGVSAWLRPKGKIWVIGTRMHSKDLYAEIMKKRAYRVLVERAVDFDTGEVLCPEDKLYTVPYFLFKKEEMGTASFNRRFMNVAIDEADAAFYEEWFPPLMDDRRPYGLVEKGHRVYIGVDPATGKGRGRSRVGICAIGYDPRDASKRYLVDYVADQLAPEKQADIIVSWYVKYRAWIVRIEKNACQLYLKSFVQERARSLGINIKIEMTYTGAQKYDIEYGVNIVAAFFENGNFRLPYADSAREKTHIFRDMLLEAPSDKPPDILMAIWFVEQHLQTLARRRANRIQIKRPPYMQLVGSRRTG